MSQKYSNYKQAPFPVPIEQHLLPYGFANHTGEKQIPKYIVIHEVSLGISKSPQTFNMDYYANKIFNDGKNGSKVGYHFLVGDKKIYQFIKEDERTNHSGTIQGNQESIGIERLICKGINYEYALHNQAKLIATLMTKWNIPIENVITHKRTQQIFEPINKSFELKLSGQVSPISKEDFLKEFHNLIQAYAQLTSLAQELHTDIDNNPTIKEFNNWLEVLRNATYKFDQLTEKQTITFLFEIIKLQHNLNKVYCQLNNEDYKPVNKQIGTLIFTDAIKYKECPNRLLIGQRGGLTKFYREINKCLKYQDFFEELLNEPLIISSKAK